MRIVTFHIHACVHCWRGVRGWGCETRTRSQAGGRGEHPAFLRAPGSWRPTPPQPQIETYAPFYTVMHSCRGGRCYGAGDPDTRRQAGGGGDAPAIPCTPGFRHPPPPLSLRASDPNMCKAGRGEGRAAPPYTATHCQNLGSHLLLTNAISKPKAHSNFLYVLRQSLNIFIFDSVQSNSESNFNAGVDFHFMPI